jgi:hypothetical protein
MAFAFLNYMKRSTSFLTLVTLLLLPVLFFITCQKEYSYEGGPLSSASSGTAIYTFVGAGGACSGAMVSGNYYAGIALDAANTIELQVDVTMAGTYNLSTSAVNGIKFSGSGSFSVTGIQTITLTGSGSPAAEGSYTFHTPATSNCSFIVLVNKAPVVQANFILSGAPNACATATVKGNYFPGVDLTASNTVTIAVAVSTVGAYTIKTDTINGISFSATGMFTNTGAQTVTLVGSGTPNIARNLTFTPRAGSSGCTFIVEVIPSGVSATYVLESGFGSPNPCIATFSGSYTAGNLLDNSNNVTIRVFVTVVGNFAIATDVVNGMIFTYSGTFTATGLQFVTMQGSGTPVAPGTFSFIPKIVGPHPLGGESCGFSITVN